MFHRIVFVFATVVFSVQAADAPAPAVLKVAIVAADSGDSRIKSTREALAFWNDTLSDLKLPLRLEEGRVVKDERLISTLVEYSHRMDRLNQNGGPGVRPPQSIGDVPEEIVLFLSAETLMSFEIDVRKRHFIAIRTASEEPLSNANVARNVIAHELGHALGLEHNADAKSLMCGRPSKCGPERYASEQLKFFPLTEQDKGVLRREFQK